MTRFALRASAKINLELRVGGRRTDGFHELRTVFQTLALHDTVIVQSSRGPFVLEGDAAAMPLDRSNLVWRAAEALWRASGRPGEPRGARARVIKRIPSQAGLGGGSSDAAAALVALSRLWRLPGRLTDLMPIAASIGADVAFFLIGGTALGLGRGDELYPLVDRSARHVVLVAPQMGVSTADAYRWLAEDRQRSKSPVPIDWAGQGTLVANDLEAPVEARHPEVAALRRLLGDLGAEAARMSGSGSAVFGLFASETPARRAAARLSARGYRVWQTRTRPRNAAERRRLA